MSVMPTVHLRDLHPRAKIFTVWEKQRHKEEVHWVMECFAEMLGVFFYVYFGIGSQLNAVLGEILGKATVSLLQVGFAYCFGIFFAITVCAGTSGGHFNPALTICFVIFKGFPVLKAVRYIIAQIFGAFFACLLIFVQYSFKIEAVASFLAQKGTLDTFVSEAGPVGGIALFLPAGQTLLSAFVNEFVTDTLIGLVIWAALDPTNMLVPPPVAPALIGLAYGNSVWGFASAGLATNTARDLGARLMAMMIWGTKAGGGSYGAIAALTNIPATVFAVTIYEFFLLDSDRVIPRASLEHAHIVANHRREKQRREHLNLRRNDVVDVELQMRPATHLRNKITHRTDREFNDAKLDLNEIRVI